MTTLSAVGQLRDDRFESIGVGEHGLDLTGHVGECGVERRVVGPERGAEHRHGSHLGQVALGGRHRELGAGDVS